MTSRDRRRSRGFVLILVMVMALLIGVLVFLFQDTVQRETRGTTRLLRSIRAEMVADSVVSRLASVLHQDPWEERFYLRRALTTARSGGDAPPIEYPFDHDSFPFHESGADYASGTTRFAGSVKDLSVAERKYRVRVMVHHRGEDFLFVYDMRYVEGLLGPLNRDPVVQRLSLVEDTPLDEIDARVDAIWKESHESVVLAVEPSERSLVTSNISSLPFEAVAVSMQEPTAPPRSLLEPAIAREESAPAVDQMVDVLEQAVSDPSMLPTPPGWTPIPSPDPALLEELQQVIAKAKDKDELPGGTGSPGTQGPPGASGGTGGTSGRPGPPAGGTGAAGDTGNPVAADPGEPAGAGAVPEQLPGDAGGTGDSGAAGGSGDAGGTGDSGAAGGSGDAGGTGDSGNTGSVPEEPGSTPAPSPSPAGI